jgi:hypothetical protein
MQDPRLFSRVLQYLRDGFLAASDAYGDVRTLSELQVEFDFYCVELPPEQHEVAFAVGSEDPNRGAISSVEKYNSAVDAWQEVRGRGERGPLLVTQ